jgi:tyrosyl-tRNA synthetase
MMSPYAFYQFWLNAEDVKVGELLRAFTFLSHEEIEELEQRTAEKPFLRAGQRRLAQEVTTTVHGPEETARIQAASAALFGGGDLRELDGQTLAAALREAGGGEVPRAAELPTIVDLLVAAGLVESRGAARRTVSEGGAYLNNERVPHPDHRPSDADLLAGEWLVLRRGKKSFAGVRLV